MKLGLSLSGGGIKGIAHIGAIKALEEENIKFSYISGTSSGSIVAMLYACGYNVEEMYNIFYKYDKTLKKLITITTTKIIETILTTFSFIFIHLIINYKINVIKSKFVFFID